MMVAAELRQTDARDGPAGDAVALNNSKHIELPDNVTRSISGDRPRTVCLWARIDKWKNKARIFEYGRKAPRGRAVRPAHLERPGRAYGRAAMERSEPLGQSTRRPEHERQHGAGADAIADDALSRRWNQA